MPVPHYGVLVGRALAGKREPDGDSPHYQIHLVAAGVHFRVAVNVKSSEKPSDLLFVVDERFRHPVLQKFAALGEGYTPLGHGTDGGLDYIRGNLFDRTAMRTLPPTLPGPDNDLSDRVEYYVGRAIRESDALVYAFGGRWGPEQDKDKIFGFKPGNGIHVIHMNQGNSPKYVKDDGVWQDGGLMLRFPAADQWVAVFLAFQSQAWHTDDVTGHASQDVPVLGPAHIPDVSEPDYRMRIVAALVNPMGPAPEPETVTLINPTSSEEDLAGWALADKQGRQCPLFGNVSAGGTIVVPVSPPAALGKAGGLITLLDSTGLKVHGVSYTAEQASREGWTVVF